MNEHASLHLATIQGIPKKTPNVYVIVFCLFVVAGNIRTGS